MANWVFDSQELRELIQRVHFHGPKKCTNCEGTGWENWNEDGQDVRPGKSELPDRVSGECEMCSGLGYNIDL